MAGTVANRNFPLRVKRLYATTPNVTAHPSLVSKVEGISSLFLVWLGNLLKLSECGDLKAMSDYTKKHYISASGLRGHGWSNFPEHALKV